MLCLIAGQKLACTLHSLRSHTRPTHFSHQRSLRLGRKVFVRAVFYIGAVCVHSNSAVIIRRAPSAPLNLCYSKRTVVGLSVSALFTHLASNENRHKRWVIFLHVSFSVIDNFSSFKWVSELSVADLAGANAIIVNAIGIVRALTTFLWAWHWAADNLAHTQRTNI